MLFQHLCRQGRDAVQVSYELDVISSEHAESEGNISAGDMTHNGAIRPVDMKTYMRGRLHLRLANIGYPSERKNMSGNSSTCFLSYYALYDILVTLNESG